MKVDACQIVNGCLFIVISGSGAWNGFTVCLPPRSTLVEFVFVAMYIKSVILDGFKSYGRRTEVHGFDPEFTAITGLNGTGKSNILDSICFVLGITNLVHVSK